MLSFWLCIRRQGCNDHQGTKTTKLNLIRDLGALCVFVVNSCLLNVSFVLFAVFVVN